MTAELQLAVLRRINRELLVLMDTLTPQVATLTATFGGCRQPRCDERTGSGLREPRGGGQCLTG